MQTYIHTHTQNQINEQANKNKTQENTPKIDIKERNTETNAHVTKIWRLGKGRMGWGSFSNSHFFPHLKAKRTRQLTIVHTIQKIHEHTLGTCVPQSHHRKWVFSLILFLVGHVICWAVGYSVLSM